MRWIPAGRTWIAFALLSAPLADADAAGRDGRAPAPDPWTGTYDVIWTTGGPAGRGTVRTRAVIATASDAQPSEVEPRFRSDLSRWSLGAAAAAGPSDLLRRFDLREYADMGWSALHADGTILCLSGRGVFICRTTPGARIATAAPDGTNADPQPTRTGLFGVMLHRGGFEMERVD